MSHSFGLRLRAVTALVVFLTSFGLPLLSFGHYVLDDDRACGSIQLSAAQPNAELGPVRPSLPQNHCALCHWLRAVGGSRTTGVTTIHAWLESTPPPVIAGPMSRPAPSLIDRPSRAPPTLA